MNIREKVKAIANSVFQFYMLPPFKMYSIFDKKYEKRGIINDFYVRNVMKMLEKHTDYYWTYQVFPKRAEQFVDIKCVPVGLPKYAVILQGPLMLEDHFTYETVKLYKKIFTDGIIIVSTWNTEDESELKLIRELGAEVVLSEFPKVCGRYNVNYQFKSSFEGMRRAKQLGAVYGFKTRTDMRIYRNNFFQEVYLILKQNPCKCGVQKERFISLGGRSGNILWNSNLSDFFLFGNIEDLLSFYGVDYDNCESREGIIEGFKPVSNRKELCEANSHAESFIYSRYFKSKGIDYNYSIKRYWEIVSDLFICMSEIDLNLYWHKYETRYMSNVRNGQWRPCDCEWTIKGYNMDYFKWNIIKNKLFPYHPELEMYMDMECDARSGMILNTESNKKLYNEKIKGHLNA